MIFQKLVEKGLWNTKENLYCFNKNFHSEDKQIHLSLNAYQLTLPDITNLPQEIYIKKYALISGVILYIKSMQ